MNRHTVSGKIGQTSGRIKEKIGDVFGNQKLANKGLAEQIKGIARQTYGDAQDAAKATLEHARAHAKAKQDRVHRYAAAESRTMRNEVRTTAENLQRRTHGVLGRFMESQKVLADQEKRPASVASTHGRTFHAG
jgi:uncharacterized protein YjbJ (UPF0337 family)